MNTTYITENDKNGKARYYRVTDGKKKVCSKAEYEAHALTENEEINTDTSDAVCETEENAQIAFEETEVSLTEVQGDFIDVSPDEYIDSDSESGKEHASPEDFFEIVKGIVSETGSKHYQKMYLQNSKKCSLICYRNRIVCTLIPDKCGTVKVKFMGTTPETRKKASLFNISNCDELRYYKDNIINQIEFIDLWYSMSQKRKAS